MSIYVVASNTLKDSQNLPLYFDKQHRSWGPRKDCTRFTDKEREEFAASRAFPDGGQWELENDGTVHYRLKCPACSNNVFEEVTVHATVSDKFCGASLYIEEDYAELDYEGGTENHGGTINRYQCAQCGHIVAKNPEEFRTWLKEHGTKAP